MATGVEIREVGQPTLSEKERIAFSRCLGHKAEHILGAVKVSDGNGGWSGFVVGVLLPTDVETFVERWVPHT